MKWLIVVAVVLLAFWVVPDNADGARVARAESTSYCLLGAMSNGKNTHPGAAAVLPGRHPLGTKIRLRSVNGKKHATFFGRRTFRIEDHIGHGSQLDLWAPSCDLSGQWGRRMVTYVVIK